MAQEYGIGHVTIGDATGNDRTCQHTQAALFATRKMLGDRPRPAAAKIRPRTIKVAWPTHSAPVNMTDRVFPDGQGIAE